MQNSENQKPPSRFALFVRLRPGIVSYFPKQQRLFTFRGDKFTDDPAKQLKNLLKHIQKSFSSYQLFELYDNDFPADSDKRIILKYNAGVFEITRLNDYQDYTAGLLLNDFLKTIIIK